MGDTDCDALVAEVLAVRDDAAVRRLVLDAWAASDRAVALRTVLAGVRDYVAYERVLAGTNPTPAGEVRGACERPAGAACWWLGRAEMKLKTKPLMGFTEAGKALPKEAMFWTQDGLGYWFRLPNGGS